MRERNQRTVRVETGLRSLHINVLTHHLPPRLSGACVARRSLFFFFRPDDGGAAILRQRAHRLVSVRQRCPFAPFRCPFSAFRCPFAAFRCVSTTVIVLVVSAGVVVRRRHAIGDREKNLVHRLSSILMALITSNSIAASRTATSSAPRRARSSSPKASCSPTRDCRPRLAAQSSITHCPRPGWSSPMQLHRD